MIGEIIKEQRLLLGMSREALSEGICSEKYIYLIETNERNPSAYILNDLSDRLGVDLFDYYQYLDYENKEQVFEHRQNFERYIQTSDIKALQKEAEIASKLPDFQKEPLIYDIQVINLLCLAIFQDKREEAIKELNNLLELKELNIDYMTLVNAHAVLAITYQMEGHWDRARVIIENAYEIIQNKTKFARYNTAVITVLILITSLLYHLEEYKELIDYSQRLKDFQEKYNEYNRFYYVDFYLSFAYYETNEPEKAFNHFMRGGYSAILFKNELDIYFITQMKGFKDVSENLDIDPGFTAQLYDIIQNNNNELG